MTQPRQDPETRQQWQSAVDAAYTCLAIDSARKYGLVEGGPEINVERCQDILDRGWALGYLPAVDAIERNLSGFGS